MRLLLAAIKQREVDERIVLDDTQVVSIVDKLIKQRKDSVAAFAQAGRTDLVDKESAEIKVLEVYLPQRLSAEAIADEVARIVRETGALEATRAAAEAAASAPAAAGAAEASSAAGSGTALTVTSS